MSILIRAIMFASLLSSSCSEAETAQDEPAQHSAADAATAHREPPGYEPSSIIPEGYNPPSLLTLTPDQQLEIFPHIEDSFATTTAKRGADAAPLPKSAQPITPSVTWGGSTYDDFDAFMTQARVSGVLALKNGEIVLERYALGRTEDERWTSFSVGKSITSLLIGAAIEDGYITSIDEPVTKYIPDLSGSAYDGVTIKQLLTMTSGVKWNEDYADPNSDVARSSYWPGEEGVNQLVSYMRMLPRAAEPGTVFSYKTGETDMAGILVAYATGRGLSQYLSEKIWAPYGMEQDAIWIVDRDSIERGGCCISMTLRDYARVGLFVLSGGVAGGKRVVPEGYLKDATSNRIEPPAMGSYGYFWWIGQDASYSARGIFGQMIYIVPEEQLIVVVNSAFPSAVAPEYTSAMTAVITAVRSATQ
jgi:CubicO group peptidase (beta-lactamase class C family)